MARRSVLLAIVAVLCATMASSSHVQVSMKATWPCYTGWRLMEASEYLADRSSTAFWGFVEDVMSSPDADALEVAAAHVNPLARDILNASLSLRAYSPAVELHRQLSRESAGVCGTDAWAIVWRPSATDESAGATIAADGSTEAGATSRAAVACSVEELKASVAAGGAGAPGRVTSVPGVFEFDHEYPGSAPDADVVVMVYGTLGTPGLGALHATAVGLSKLGTARYLLRHALELPEDQLQQTYLRGYGVLLDIKNMEYKALDDRPPTADGAATEENTDEDGEEEDVAGILFSTLASRHPGAANELAELKRQLLNAATEDAEVKVWDMKDLGYQAVQHIMSATEAGLDPLTRLVQVSGNFPALARWLSKQEVPKKLRKEIEANSRTLGQGQNFILANGKILDASSPSFNIFKFLKDLHAETELMEAFMELPVGADTRAALQALRPNGEVSDVRINVRKGSKGVIHFVNNIEKDAQYKRWPTAFATVLQPTWQLHSVRRNLYTVVIALDGSTYDGLAAVYQVAYFISAMAPIRFGIVLTGDPDAPLPDIETDKVTPLQAHHVARLFQQAVSKHNVEAAWTFLKGLAKTADKARARSEEKGTALKPLTLAKARSAYHTAIKAATSAWTTTAAKEEADDALVDEDGSGKAALVKTRDFMELHGLPPSSITVNGLLIKDLDMQQIMSKVSGDLRVVQQLVSSGVLQGKVNVYSALLRNSFSVSRYNEVVLSEEKFVSLVTPEGRELLSELAFATGPVGQDAVVSVSAIAAHDFGTAAGVTLLREAAAFLTSGADRAKLLRVAAVDMGGTELGRLVAAIWSRAAATARPKKYGPFLLEFCDVAATALAEHGSGASAAAAVAKQATSLAGGILGSAGAGVAAALGQEGADRASAAASAARALLTGHGGVPAVIANGRVLSLAGLSMAAGDFELLVEFDDHLRSAAVANVVRAEAFKDKAATGASISDTIQRCASVVGTNQMSDRQAFPMAALHRSHTHIHATPADGRTSGLEVVAVLDPLSQVTQRLSPILLLLRDVLHADVKVFLQPQAQLSELPLSSFYRYALPGSNDAGGVVFKSMPHHLLTMKVDVPEPWIVQADVAHYDLDNLRMDEISASKRNVAVEYQLKRVLVAGQCDDETHLKPPNGLQLELRRDELAALAAQDTADTLVMQNLGYFQLQASPGVWKLELAPGRASELYALMPADEAESTGLVWQQQRRKASPVDTDSKFQSVPSRSIVVRDFSGPITHLKVAKRPGKEEESLLATLDEPDDVEAKGEDEKGSLWQKLGNLLGGSSTAPTPSSTNDTIHVFSLASGHLYERFLRIMMLSVVKRTENPVKFWLVENFLSPGFKDTIPALAEKFGFEVGMVTYKWPNWLRQQTEKQRIIWGYKILFLDTLFPLNVKKVIYVDADQVVRADLKELWDMDLQGAPYGYTPFCTSREETLGFQFWRQGYWSNHLRGKPYHISALYVVDLVRFRQLAAGDQLRAIYDQLSRDPNSLSNLDQDLPNYTQHMIPIFSLPTEWLWCESWCSDETKPTAKTIDLCNNPLHKEPKLDMARRVISGELFPESWVELDEEVRAAEVELLA